MVRNQALPIAQSIPEANTFSLEKVAAHVTQKANYKQVGQGVVAKKTVSARLRALVEGNTAADRYRRYAFEASQRVSGVMLAEKYLATQCDAQRTNRLDWSTNKQVQSRFWRQDNIRFDACIHEQSSALSRRDRWAVRFSRWAQVANGVTELGAAPTGLLLKSTRLALQPKIAENTSRSQIRVLAVLGPIAAAVSIPSLWLGQKGVGKLAKYTAPSIETDIRALIGSFSALSAVSALVSLCFAGTSARVASRSPLRRDWVERIQSKQNMHIERLYLMLNDAKNKPNAQALICKALNRKIAKNFRNNHDSPLLLSRLLADVQQAPHAEAAKAAMEQTIGSYLTEADATGVRNGQFLDPKLNKAQLLQRENHFVALTNLIEHARIDEKKDNPGFKDVRHHIEGVAEVARKVFLARQPAILRTLGFPCAAKQAAERNTEEYQDAREARQKNSVYAAKYKTSGSRILERSHQYGPVTVLLARASESLRVINHGIVLSLNYQLTRPIAWVAGRLTEGVFKEPNSRCVSFSIGRFIASSVWAAVDAFLFISLAGGQGVGLNGPEANIKLTFPLQIPLGLITLPISIVSTAAQMIVVAIPAVILTGAAKVACHFEGWEGDVARTADTYQGRGAMQAWSVK